MVDDRMSLVFSVRNNPGRYALLIGSGVSTGAGIPTGWAVVEDLLEKLATAQGEGDPEDPFEWYKQEYGEEARYGNIIGELADSKEERRALLEDYFEATEEEREAGDKTPDECPPCHRLARRRGVRRRSHYDELRQATRESDGGAWRDSCDGHWQ